MAKPNRVRRVMKWARVVTCFTFMVSWGLSIYGYAGVDYGRVKIVVQCGGLSVILYKRPAMLPTRFEHWWRLNSCLLLVPVVMSTGSMELGLFVPFWLPLLAVAIPTYILWRRDRRKPEGCCQNCGYDLRGTISERCSECGAEIKRP